MCNCQYRSLTSLVLALVMTSPLLALSKKNAGDFSTDAGRIRHGLQDAGYADPDFDNRLKAQQKELQPLFVIVPGILGSKLKKGDDVVWGEVGLVNGVKREDLEFAQPAGGGALEPEFMDRVSIKRLTTVDVYGTLRDDLRFTSLSGVPWCEEFSYDWRDDIRVSAERFHGFLMKKHDEVKDRKVVVIAHSMGGLVVRWWYDAFYRNPAYQPAYTFLRPPLILFLGVPHFGSASALLRLVEGFSADSTFAGVTNFILRGLNDAASSFYSVYELLPFNDTAVEFRSLEGKPSVSNDLLDAEFWRVCEWGGTIRDRDARKFYGELLPARLDATREFRDTLLHQKPIPNTVCFYSDRHEGTPFTLKVQQHGSGRCTVKVDRRSPGDGSVPAEVTDRSRRPDHPHDAVYRLRAGHMALPNAQGFRTYIHNLRLHVLVQSVAGANPSDKVIRAFRDAKALFPLPLDMAALGEPDTQRAVSLNRRILGGTSDRALADSVYKMAERAKDGSDEASQLYALALALDPDGPRAPFAANNVAHNLLENDLWFAARGYLDHAQKHAGQVPRSETQFLAKLQKNTGVSYEKTGDPCLAIRYYERAGQEGKADRKRLNSATGGRCPP